MIITRSLTAIKLTHHMAKNLLVPNLKNNVQTQISRRAGDVYYRKLAPPTPGGLRYLETVMFIFWWWVTWNCITEYHELIPKGMPDASNYTDEELGIPPDDAD